MLLCYIFSVKTCFSATLGVPVILDMQFSGIIYNLRSNGNTMGR